MGMGSSGQGLKLPPMPGQAPDLMDPEVIAARKAAMRSLAAKQGLQSTFLTTPKLGDSPLLSGTGGP